MSWHVDVTFLPTSGNFRANCTACEAYLKFLSSGAFTVGEKEPKPTWVVLGQSVADPSTDEVLAVCADEKQALNAQATLRGAGFINTKVSEVSV
jgi:hypothetical protein